METTYKLSRAERKLRKQKKIKALLSLFISFYEDYEKSEISRLNTKEINSDTYIRNFFESLYFKYLDETKHYFPKNISCYFDNEYFMFNKSIDKELLEETYREYMDLFFSNLKIEIEKNEKEREEKNHG